MEMITYDDFARLRIGQFWTAGTKTYSAFGTESYIGFADGEALPFVYFLWRPETPGEVVEIRLEDLYSDKPDRWPLSAVLRALNLPLRGGMTKAEVTEILGRPVEENAAREELEFCRFIVGKRWRYSISCSFRGNKGLIGVSIVRNSLYKRQKGAS